MTLTLSRPRPPHFREYRIVELQPVDVVTRRADPVLLRGAAPTRARRTTPEDDLVDEWGKESFPASDPPANWRGGSHDLSARTGRRPAAPTPDDERRCAACPHPLADHDAIGLRVCRATLSAGTGRGCACR